MELAKGKECELAKYGFVEIGHNFFRENGIDQYDPMAHMTGFVYDIGHSRRGQSYYLICSDEGKFSLYASKPDGSCGDVHLNDIFLRLVRDGIVKQ